MIFYTRLLAEPGSTISFMATDPYTLVSHPVTVNLKDGIHARPAAILVQEYGFLSGVVGKISPISVHFIHKKSDKTINITNMASIMSVMTAGISRTTKLQIKVSFKNEQAPLAILQPIGNFIIASLASFFSLAEDPTSREIFSRPELARHIANLQDQPR